MDNNVYPLRATQSEDARAALQEMIRDRAKTRYIADRTAKVNVEPTVQDVTPREATPPIMRMLGAAALWVAVVVACAFLFGCDAVRNDRRAIRAADASSEPRMQIYNDAEFGVRCYRMRGSEGISCIKIK